MPKLREGVQLHRQPPETQENPRRVRSSPVDVPPGERSHDPHEDTSEHARKFQGEAPDEAEGDGR